MSEKPARGPRDEIDDWMQGTGGKVFAGVMLLLGVWFVVNLFL